MRQPGHFFKLITNAGKGGFKAVFQYAVFKRHQQKRELCPNSEGNLRISEEICKGAIACGRKKPISKQEWQNLVGIQGMIHAMRSILPS